MTIVVVDYDPAWPRVFTSLSARIWPAVADVASSIEHVGSTAVPGLPAKPVIDLDVVVPDDSVRVGIIRLERIGYEHRGDLGVPGREAFRSPSGSTPHHLYLCPQSSPALANHLAVRDDLRRDPAQATAYGRLKKELALEFPGDIDRYITGKTDFLLAVMRRSGMADELVSDIERRNKGLPGP